MMHGNEDVHRNLMLFVEVIRKIRFSTFNAIIGAGLLVGDGRKLVASIGESPEIYASRSVSETLSSRLQVCAEAKLRTEHAA